MTHTPSKNKLRAEQINDPPDVICPVCRKFSEEGMIMENFFIKDLAQLHKSVKEQKRVLCKLCSNKGKTIDAKCRCLDCKERLCDDCKAAHDMFPLLKGHTIVELGEDSDLVVDHLVYCSIHKDEPIILYCEPCNALLCITCKLNKHNTHVSQTIDEALQHIIPEMEKSTEFINENIDVLAKSLEDVEIKIMETKESYKKCSTVIDNTAEARKHQIEETRVKMKQDLQAKENEEVRKLESVKQNLKMKQQERENLKKVVRMSLDRARHVTLLSEFIQGGLQSQIREMRDQPEAPVKIQVNQPQLNTKNAEWEKIIQQGVIGSVEYNMVSLIVAVAFVITRVCGSRYWDVNFTEYFSKNFKKMLEIKPGGQCFKIKLLNDTIWAPLYHGNVNVYNKDGNIMKTIAIKSPITIQQADNGDIFIACHSNSGLYVLDSNVTPRKICDGSFADVYAHRDKLYALEYEKKIIMTFICRPDVNDVKRRWRSETQCGVDEAEVYDNLIVTGDEHLKVFVSHVITDKISQYNTLGQYIKCFGSRQTEGDGNVNQPWLCGVDRQSHLLVADQFNSVYKILDPRTGQWGLTQVRGESSVCDAKLDNEGKLWLCQYNGKRECIITKLEPQ